MRCQPSGPQHKKSVPEPPRTDLYGIYMGDLISIESFQLQLDESETAYQAVDFWENTGGNSMLHVTLGNLM